MTKEELIETLKKLQEDDPEEAHVGADSALLEYINDEDIQREYQKIRKWYA